MIRKLLFCKRVIRHPRTPRPARWLLVVALVYLAMPFDLIPDGIPVIGHIDDVIIVPLLMWLALKCVPKDVIQQCQTEMQ